MCLSWILPLGWAQISIGVCRARKNPTGTLVTRRPASRRVLRQRGDPNRGDPSKDRNSYDDQAFLGAASTNFVM